MAYLDRVLTRLTAPDTCGYHAGSAAAAEPAAVAALALLAHNHAIAALPLADWLLSLQGTGGSVGIDGANATPEWPTGWAVMTWRAAEQSSFADEKYPRAIQRAIGWMSQAEGVLIQQMDWLGHDTTIKGWPWVIGTHSWLEPTAINVVAFKHTGNGNHPRAREAVRMLKDRLLSSGGANYGNTIILNQELRPHVQPTGLCLLALAGEEDVDGRIDQSIAYLKHELQAKTTTESLCYGLLGLAAHRQTPAGADDWLAAAAERTLARDPAGYKLGLLALAALGDSCPIIPASSEATAP